MPEYSSTTITPSDEVQVPGMNGSTSGNFLLSALKSYILSEKGLANGLASLDGNGKLLSSQLPDLADDVIVVDSYATLPATGTAGKIYITADNNKMYRWDPDLETPNYVDLSIDLTEYARIEDIQDGNIQAGVAVKAFQDAMGRAIITTYETKADASDLKDAIQGNSQRIENLEVAVSGSLVQTNTDATMANTKTITNANEILPWAILKRVGARAVAWNQLIENGNFASTQNWTSNTPNDGPLSASSNIGKITLTSSVSSAGIYQNVNTISGHRILLHFRYKVTTSVANPRVRVVFSNGGSGDEFTETCTSGVWHEVFRGIGLTDSWSRFYILSSYGVTYATGDTFEFSDVFLHDLTTMNMASLTANQFRTLFPASYYPYTSNPSIIPLNPSAFKVVGRNKIDISTMVRTDKDGTPINGWLRWTTLVRYESGQIYYMKCNALDFTVFAFQIFFYDADGNFISGDSSNKYINPNTGFSFTLPSVAGAFYFSVGFYHSSSLASYTPTEVLLCLNSVTDKTYEAYKETTIPTLQIADGHYVNENCYDYVENVIEDGVVKGKFHDVADVKTFSSSEEYGYTNKRWRILVSGIKRAATGDNVGNLTLEGYETTSTGNLSWNALNGGSKKMVAVDNSSDYVYFYIPNATSSSDLATVQSELSGKILYFELATESVTDCEPIPNFPCEDGTTITAVTPQTDLVNAIDVPNTIAYMTKISS